MEGAWRIGGLNPSFWVFLFVPRHTWEHLMRYLLALLVSVLLVPTPSMGQEFVQVFVGDRVRITAPECQMEKQTGTLVSFSLEDNLLSATSGEREIQCPVTSLTQFEVSLGEREWWEDSVKGLRYGALAGLAGAVAILAADEPEDAAPTSEAVLALAGASGAGFLIGTLIGAVRDGEDWAEVTSFGSVQPWVAPSGMGSLQVGFSIRLRN